MRLDAIGSLAAAAWLLLAAAAPGQELRTLKERLSDKASDAQRVDNCRVPVERRGPIPRPDCVTKPPSRSPTAAHVLPDPVLPDQRLSTATSGSLPAPTQGRGASQ